MHSLTDKRVFITGGGSGIGRSLALRFAREGAEVHLGDLDVGAAEGGGAGHHGGRRPLEGVEARRHQARAEIAGVRRRILDERAPSTCSSTTPGIVHGGTFLDVPLDRHRSTFQVNILGVVAVTHAFLPDLAARPDAHIVNIASAAGFTGLPFASTYAASKWAVIGFSESIRLELLEQGRPHVRVTTVCPGYVGTGMFEGARALRLTRILKPETRGGSHRAGSAREPRDGDDAVGRLPRPRAARDPAAPGVRLDRQAVRRADEHGAVERPRPAVNQEAVSRRITSASTGAGPVEGAVSGACSRRGR